MRHGFNTVLDLCFVHKQINAAVSLISAVILRITCANEGFDAVLADWKRFSRKHNDLWSSRFALVAVTFGRHNSFYIYHLRCIFSIAKLCLSAAIDNVIAS